MIYIIIPNYNGLKHLQVCYDSLRRQTYKDFKTILVDNNSADESVSFTNQNYPEVIILKLSSNTGFAKAVNEGIKYALNDKETEYVILLNNDIECDTEFVNQMYLSIKENNTGSAACKMLNFFDRTKIDDAGDFLKGKGSPFARGYNEKDMGQYDSPGFIFGACAGAAIYKKEVFESVGFFDEDFFAYFEDVDFSFRLQLMGYKCFYNPKAICYHKRGATGKAKAGFETMLCEKNLIALRIKNYPLSLLIRYFPYFFLVRIKRYFFFWKDISFEVFRMAVKGYFRGLMELPKSLKKRKVIQANKVVSNKYVEEILK